MLNFYWWNEWHGRWASRWYLVEVETRLTLWYREDLWWKKKGIWRKHTWLWPQNPPHVDPVAGLAQFRTPNDVLKSLRRMKNGKAAGPSGVVAEMLKATPDICSKTIVDLMNAIMREGKVPADWSGSIIVSLFKWKGDALDRNNYRGLKLTDHVLKVIERVIENIIRETVNIDYFFDEFLFLDSFKGSILRNTVNFIWHLSIWKRPLIECL